MTNGIFWHRLIIAFRVNIVLTNGDVSVKRKIAASSRWRLLRHRNTKGFVIHRPLSSVSSHMLKYRPNKANTRHSVGVPAQPCRNPYAFFDAVNLPNTNEHVFLNTCDYYNVRKKWIRLVTSSSSAMVLRARTFAVCGQANDFSVSWWPMLVAAGVLNRLNYDHICEFKHCLGSCAISLAISTPGNPRVRGS